MRTLDDPDYERDVKVLASKYLKGKFTIDFMCTVPILLYDIFYPLDSDVETEDLWSNKNWFVFFFWLKLLRFL